MKYRITTFKTLTGKLDFIDLGDHAYGEWVIYESKIPKFHVDCFRENSRSDSLINELIKNHGWTIERILNRINVMEGRKLEFVKRPLIEIEDSSELRELQLGPLPLEWIEKIRKAANKS